jgi:hypothetical protein
MLSMLSMLLAHRFVIFLRDPMPLRNGPVDLWSSVETVSVAGVDLCLTRTERNSEVPILASESMILLREEGEKIKRLALDRQRVCVK